MNKTIDEFAESKAQQTFDDSVRKCPYCGNSYQPEAADYSEDSREEECSECGKTYRAHDCFTVTHYGTPDCELNGEAHVWVPRRTGLSRTHPFCDKCDKCMPMSLIGSAMVSE